MIIEFLILINNFQQYNLSNVYKCFPLYLTMADFSFVIYWGWVSMTLLGSHSMAKSLWPDSGACSLQ